jgi:YidC/Oxa1 family membrane protein insertase
VGKIPFIALIAAAVGLQYLQMKLLSGRNPVARQANPQMQRMQQLFPLIFAVIYISIPAAVNVYFIVSSLFRVAQQEFIYRREPKPQTSS